jgi:hypothetical protein
VSHQVNRLKPILNELDSICPFTSPVLVDKHLIPLFEKHSGKKIEKIPVQSNVLRGLHAGTADGQKALIVYKRCEAHHDGHEVEPTCPGCQESRYDIAKELIHCLDLDGEKTAPDEASGALLEQLMQQAWSANPQTLTDGWAQLWGLELLIRFRFRVLIRAGSMNYQMAKASENFAYFAGQFAVPEHIVRHAFADKYMDLMKGIRDGVGLPITVPDPEHASAY